MEDYNSDIYYLNDSNYYRATNPRIKNNTYTFYYKLHKYDYKKYILIRPGKETLKYDKINITRLPKLPYEFIKSLKVTTKINDYIYTNISNIPIGNEVYFIVVIPTGNITIKYKFSEENFYEDYTDINLISPKYKYSLYDAEYYYFKKESKTANFLLFEISSENKYNFTIYQTEKDEYLEIKKKKNILIIVICVGIALLIVMIASLIVYKTKQIANENYAKVHNQGLINKK